MNTLHHPVASAEQWLAQRKALLAREKELTHLKDQVARERRALPWVRIDKHYVFDTPSGPRTLAELFDGRRQLVVQHFMYTPGAAQGCKSCSYMADHTDGALAHLAQRDTTVVAVSRAPLADLERMRKAGMWDCLAQKSRESGAALKRAEEQAIAALSKWDENAKFIHLAKEKLRASSKAYERYRDAQCAFAASLVGGAIDNALDMRRLSCLISLNNECAKQLHADASAAVEVNVFLVMSRLVAPPSQTLLFLGDMKKPPLKSGLSVPRKSQPKDTTRDELSSDPTPC